MTERPDPFDIPVVESTALPPGTMLLTSRTGVGAVLFQPHPPRWWREPVRWYRTVTTQARIQRELRRRREMVAWLALYRPDLRFVRWGRSGGAVVAPRVDLPEGRVVVTSLGWDGDRLALMAELRLGLSLLDPKPWVTITDMGS